MILRTKVSGGIDPSLLPERCRRAEHVVALQAERDTRLFVPRKTGKLVNSVRVVGKYIVWDQPYARALYIGRVVVDPKTKAGGFLTKDGWKSRRGVKKVRSDRPYTFATGGPEWFARSKERNVEAWVRLAQKEVGHE